MSCDHDRRVERSHEVTAGVLVLRRCLDCGMIGAQLNDTDSVWSRMLSVEETEPLTTLDPERERLVVMFLGNQIGFKRTMQLAEECWLDVLEAQGQSYAGTDLTCGPASVLMVPCLCPETGDPWSCQWCAGTGRVTKRVREAQDPTHRRRRVPKLKQGVSR